MHWKYYQKIVGNNQRIGKTCRFEIAFTLTYTKSLQCLERLWLVQVHALKSDYSHSVHVPEFITFPSLQEIYFFNVCFLFHS